MLAGFLLSTLCAACGLAYAFWANRRWPTPVPATGERVETTPRPDSGLPPLWLALAPIVLPVVLISLRTAADIVTFPPDLARIVAIVGHPNVALALAAVVALVTVATRPGQSRQTLRGTVQTALADAGVIILVTAAGGVFGGILQETGIGERIQGLAREYRIGLLPLAFIVTALIRGAQGSATVAMVTAVGILGSFATPETLGCHPVYLALTIGCASKLLLWMNDSGFWVMCKTSGLAERETLRSISVMFTIMGTAGFLIVLVAAHLFPLV